MGAMRVAAIMTLPILVLSLLIEFEPFLSSALWSHRDAAASVGLGGEDGEALRAVSERSWERTFTIWHAAIWIMVLGVAAAFLNILLIFRAQELSADAAVFVAAGPDRRDSRASVSRTFFGDRPALGVLAWICAVWVCSGLCGLQPLLPTWLHPCPVKSLAPLP